MKWIFVLVLFVTSSVNAQTWQEWTQQKKTRKKYLLQQSAALKVYADYAAKGYAIANTGLHTIRQIKDGDFSIHRDFLGSLKKINPAIKQYAKVAEIVLFQTRLIRQAKQTLQAVRDADKFSSAEIDHCAKVFDNVLRESLQNLEELLVILTPDKLEMKDDERIRRIDILYADMQEKYAFSSAFSEEMALLTVQRMRELKDVDVSRTLNGLR